jgi:hypothetical protein
MRGTILKSHYLGVPLRAHVPICPLPTPNLLPERAFRYQVSIQSFFSSYFLLSVHGCNNTHPLGTDVEAAGSVKVHNQSLLNTCRSQFNAVSICSQSLVYICGLSVHGLCSEGPPRYYKILVASASLKYTPPFLP